MSAGFDFFAPTPGQAQPSAPVQPTYHRPGYAPPVAPPAYGGWPTTPLPPTIPGAPYGGWVPGPPARRRLTWAHKTLIGLGVVMAVFAVAYKTGLLDASPHITTPAHAAGLTRIESPRLSDIVGRARQQLRDEGVVHPVAALYGQADGTPAAMVVGGTLDSSANVAAERAGMMRGFERGAGAGVLQLQSFPTAGHTFECGTIRVATAQAGVCSWVDGHTMGLVVGFAADAEGTATLAGRLLKDMEK